VAFRLRRRIAGKGAKSDGKRFSGIMRRDICSSLRLRKGNGRPAGVFNSWALRGLIAAGTGPRPPANPIKAQGSELRWRQSQRGHGGPDGEEAVSLGSFCQNAIRGCIRQSSPQWWRFGPFHLTQKFARLFCPPPNSFAAAKPPGEAHSPFIYDDLAGVTRANRFNLNSLCHTV